MRHEPHPDGAMAMSRRQLLASAIAAAALSLLNAPTVHAADLTVEAFLDLSKRLTGDGDLSIEIATTILKAILASENPGDLQALADGTLADSGALANRIVGDWYSGMAEGEGGAMVVATYEKALVWSALPFTKPMGVCGGAVGYWQNAPGESALGEKG